jgi:hypothetical protein
MEKPINEIEYFGKIYGTDKIGQHGYHRFYDKELIEYKNMKDIGILEIGVESFESIRMWQSYFPHAFIYGIDIHKEYKDSRIQVFKTDQSNINNLEIIKNEIAHPIYFINDDGSHVPEHQLISFDFLFSNVLQEGGVYIIEDIMEYTLELWRNKLNEWRVRYPHITFRLYSIPHKNNPHDNRLILAQRMF